MKATSLLVKQHQKAKGLFKKLESGKAGANVLNELANDLGAHMAIEQEIFYPAIRKLDPNLVAESFEEHAIAELALKRLLMVSPESSVWKARVTTLKELILHHVQEEEGELFPEIEKTMEDRDLQALGKQMKMMFDECVERGFEALVPKGMTDTSADDAQRPSRRSRRVASPNGEAATHRTAQENGT